MIRENEKDILNDIFKPIASTSVAEPVTVPIKSNERAALDDVFGPSPVIQEKPTRPEPVQQSAIEQSEDRFQTKPEPAVAGTTEVPTDPLIGEKYKSIAEAESPLVAGAKEAGLALTYGKSPVSEYRRQEHPIASTIGTVAGTVIPTVLGGTGIVKSITAVPKIAQIAKTGKAAQVAVNGVARASASAIDYIIRNNENLISPDENVKTEARKNLAINIAASLASPIPETYLPTSGLKSLIQPAAQAATDVLVEALGQAATGDNAFDSEHAVNTAISAISSALFGIADVKDVSFKSALKKLIGVGKAGEWKLSEEASQRIDENVKNAIKATDLPSTGKVIEPEEPPQFETQTMPSGIEVTRHVRKPPTETELQAIDEQGRVAQEIDRLMKEVEAEPIDTGNLPKRERGILSQTGGGGEKKQTRIPIESQEDSPAQRAQMKLDKQREDVRQKFVPTLKQRIRDAVDYIGAGVVDREYYAKRLLSKTPEGNQAIGKLNASKGSSAEAKTQYDSAEKVISENLPHDMEELFADYLQAKRILEIESVKGEGAVKHTGGMTVDEAKAFIDRAETSLPKEKSDALRVSADRYWKAMNDQLVQLKDAGLINEESFKNLSEQGRNYSPRKFIQHIDPDRVSTDARGRRVSVSDSGIKGLDTGSEQAMLNNWRLLLSEVVARTQSRIFKNNASKELYNFVKSNPENDLNLKLDEKPDNDLPAGYERISTVIDGEQRSILVPTKFAASWNSSDQAMSRSLAKILNLFSGAFIVRPLATGALAPEFAFSNVPRDAAMQWLVTKEYSPVAPVALFQIGRNFLRVAKDAWTGEGRYRDYVKQGGGMEYLYEQGAMFRDPTKPVSATTERNRQIKQIFTKIQEFSERLGRLALREQALINGKSPEEATRIAREYLDFAQGGSWTKAIDNARPYLNASIQGTRSGIKAFREDKATFSLKALQLLTMGAGLAYTANQYNPETTERITDREKVTRWNFPLPFKTSGGDPVYFSIPKDQSSRLFATIGETMAERHLGKVSGKTAWNKIKMAFADINPVDVIGFVPPIVSAVIGYSLNKDFWMRDDVWKGREVSPHMEFYQGHTPQALTDLAGQLSKIGIEISPARAESALGQVIPKNLITALMGMAYEQVAAGLPEKERKQLDKSAVDWLSSIPGARKYIRKTYPERIDLEKLAEGISKYKIEVRDSKGRRKTNRILQKEVLEAEMSVNDIKQMNDAKAKIISELFLAGDKEAAVAKWKELSKEAAKVLGEREIKRINERLMANIKRGR